MRLCCIHAACLLLSVGALAAAPATIAVNTGQPGPEINPRMYGVFLEEINTAVDGGLYGELIRNRGFEDAKPPEGFVRSTNSPNNNVVSQYLDGELVNEATAEPAPRLFAQAGRDRATGELVLQAINVSAQPVTADLQIDGGPVSFSSAALAELKSPKPSDNNTLDQPMKVAPLQSRIEAGAQPVHEFPPYSLSVIRLKTP
jgi:alpha-L-arabinofuranosidase